MTQQTFTLTRKNSQFRIEKSISDDISYDVFWGEDFSLSPENKQFLGSFTHATFTFENPDPNRRLYFYLSSETSHYLISERKVMVRHLNNLRDLGGYATDDGRLTRFGLLFRSDDLFSLDSRDVTYLEQMHIASIVDYRSESERNSRPNKELAKATQYVCSPNAKVAELASASMETDRERIDQLLAIADSPNAQAYFDKGRVGMAEEMARFVTDPIGIAAFKGLLDIVKNPHNAPIIQHCRGGKDRTGYGTALILFILGVPQQTIMNDYLLTIEMNKTRNQKRMAQYRQYTDHPVVLQALADAMSTQANYLQASIDAMSDLAGSPLEYIQHYLGITPEDQETIKAFYSYSPKK